MTRFMKPITRKAIAYMPSRAFSFLIFSSAIASVDKRVANEATPIVIQVVSTYFNQDVKR